MYTGRFSRLELARRLKLESPEECRKRERIDAFFKHVDADRASRQLPPRERSRTEEFRGLSIAEGSRTKYLKNRQNTVGDAR